MSASTGVAPACNMVLTVAQKVNGVVITSSPGPTRSAAASARWRPAVAEFTASAWPARTYSRKARSNCAVAGPVVNHPDFRTLRTSSISVWPISGVLNGMKADLSYAQRPADAVAIRLSRVMYWS